VSCWNNGAKRLCKEPQRCENREITPATMRTPGEYDTQGAAYICGQGVYDVMRLRRSSTHGDSLKRYESSTSEQGGLEQDNPLKEGERVPFY